MRRLSVRNLLLSVMAALALAGCGNNTTTPTTPTTSVTVTETFEGTLTKNGAVTHSFATAASGTVTATATTLDPDTTTVGLALGTWNGVACQVVIANDKAVMGTVVTGSVAGAGSLCARIYDADGSLTDPVPYTVTVVHP